ncbi:MAG TPA: sulfocyanin-like copper-binding protein, partial [Solirubrobacteraceae bacterium]
ARKMAVLTLRVHGDGRGLGDFNGYSRGQVLVQIPAGWRISVRCVNDSSVPRSCSIVENSLSTGSALPRASTPNPTEVSLQDARRVFRS